MSGLTKNIIEFNFTAGVDQKTSPNMTKGMFEIINGQFTKNGEIAKRRAFNSLTQSSVSSSISDTPTLSYTQTNGTIATGSNIVAYNNELLLFNTSSLFSFASGSNTWVNKNTLYPCSIREKSVCASVNNQLQATTAISGALRCTSWYEVEENAVKVCVQDINTDTYILNPTQVYSGTDLFRTQKVIYSSGSFWIVYPRSSQLYARTISCSNPFTINAEISIYNTIATGCALTNNFFDVVPWEHPTSGSLIGGAILRDGGRVDGFKFSPTTLTRLASSSHTIIPADDIYCVTHTTNGIQAMCKCQLGHASVYNWNQDIGLTNSVVNIFNDVNSDISGNVANRGTGVMVSAGTFGVVEYYMEYEAQAIAYTPNQDINKRFSYIRRCQWGTSTVSQSVWLRNAQLLTVPFTSSNQTFLGITYYSPVQSGHYLMTRDSYVLGRFAVNQAHCHYQRLSPATQTSNGMFEFAFPKQGRFETSNGKVNTRDHVYVARVNLTSQQLKTDILGDTLVGCNGNPFIYDGLKATELGFNTFPELRDYPSPIANDHWGTFTVSPGNMNAGTYTYYATSHYTDNKGNEYRSSPSVAQVVFASANQSVTASIPNPTISNKNNIQLKLWRTENTGSVPYLITSGSSPLFASTSGSYTTWIDNMRDSEIIGNERLYTLGGILGNDPPPSSVFLKTHKNRVWFVDNNDNLTLWYSKEFAAGLGVETSQLLTIRLPGTGGSITGLASLGQILVVFKQNAIYAIVGEGPDSTGGNGSFNNPEKLPVDFGCTNSRSIETTDDGVYFLSQRGLYLMRSIGDLEYIGAPMEDTFNGLTITSAQSVPDVNEVRFTSQEGPIVVYNSLFKRFSHFDNLPASSTTVYKNQYCLLSSSGLVKMEQLSGSLYDDGVAYPMTITTPWIQASQHQGYQRMWKMGFLGSFLSNHDLAVTCSYDYGSYVTESFTVSGITVAAPHFDSYQWVRRLGSNRQKLEAIKIRMSDISIGGTAQSYLPQALTFEVGVLNGMYRFPNNRKI